MHQLFRTARCFRAGAGGARALAIAVFALLTLQAHSLAQNPWFELTYTYAGATTTISDDPNYSSTNLDWAALGNIQRYPLPPGVSCAAGFSITANLAGTVMVHGP